MEKHQLTNGCRRDVKGSYEVRKRIIPNDKRAKWITEGDETGKPEYTSAAMPWSGFAALRTGWGQDDTWALMDAAHLEERISMRISCQFFFIQMESFC